MKHSLLFLVFLVAIITQAQKHELGASLGGTNYKGDFTNDNFEIKNYLPAGLLFYKNNITPAFGIRYHVMLGGIRASDQRSPDPVYVRRNLSLNNLLVEGAAQIEYNFLNYRSETNRLKWTPYFLIGLGAFYFPPYSNSSGVTIQPCIPIGAGLRLKVMQNWNIGIEAAARKTFSDMIDNTNGSVYAGNNDTQDWYFYNGITFSRTLYHIYCPKPRH